MLNLTENFFLGHLIDKSQKKVKYISSDEFIQAQQQLARWASEDVVSVVVMDPGSDSTIGPLSTGAIHGDSKMGANGISMGPRDYYPSPPSTETESSGSIIPIHHQQQPQQQHQQLQRRGHIVEGQGDGLLMDSTGRYPEYKH